MIQRYLLAQIVQFISDVISSRPLSLTIGLVLLLAVSAGCGGGNGDDPSSSCGELELLSVDSENVAPGDQVTVYARYGCETADARFSIGGVFAPTVSVSRLDTDVAALGMPEGCEDCWAIVVEVPSDIIGEVEIKGALGEKASNTLFLTVISAPTPDSSTSASGSGLSGGPGDFSSTPGVEDPDDGGCFGGCPSGEICENGSCRPLRCPGEMSCPADQVCDESTGACAAPSAGCLVDENEVDGNEAPDFLADADETGVFSFTPLDIDRPSYGAIRFKTHADTTEAYVYGTFPVTKVSGHPPPDDPSFWENPAYANSSWTGRYLVRPALFDAEEGDLVPMAVANGDLVECLPSDDPNFSDDHFCEGLEGNFDLDAIDAAVNDAFVHGRSDLANGRVYRWNLHPSGVEGEVREILFQLTGAEHTFVPVARCGEAAEAGEKVEVETPPPTLTRCEVKPDPYAPFVAVTMGYSGAVKADIHVDYKGGTGDFMLDLMGQGSAHLVTDDDLRNLPETGELTMTRYVPMKTSLLKITCSAVGAAGEEADAFQVALGPIVNNIKGPNSDLDLNAAAKNDLDDGCSADLVKYETVRDNPSVDDDAGRCDAILNWNFSQKLVVTRASPSKRPNRKAIATGSGGDEFRVPWAGKIRVVPYANVVYDTTDRRWEGTKKVFGTTCENSGPVFEFKAGDYTGGSIRTEEPARVFGTMRTKGNGSKKGGSVEPADGVGLVCFNDEQTRCSLNGTYDRPREHETCNFYTLQVEQIEGRTTLSANAFHQLHIIPGATLGDSKGGSSEDGERLSFLTQYLDLRYYPEFRIADFNKILDLSMRRPDTGDGFEDPTKPITLVVPWEGQHLAGAPEIEVWFFGQRGSGHPHWFDSTGGDQITYGHIRCDEGIGDRCRIPGSPDLYFDDNAPLRTDEGPTSTSNGYDGGYPKQGEASPVPGDSGGCTLPITYLDGQARYVPACLKVTGKFRRYLIRVTARDVNGEELVREVGEYSRGDRENAVLYGNEPHLSIDYVNGDDIPSTPCYLDSDCPAYYNCQASLCKLSEPF